MAAAAAAWYMVASRAVLFAVAVLSFSLASGLEKRVYVGEGLGSRSFGSTVTARWS
jgi:hypothetical protein